MSGPTGAFSSGAGTGDWGAEVFGSSSGICGGALAMVGSLRCLNAGKGPRLPSPRGERIVNRLLTIPIKVNIPSLPLSSFEFRGRNMTNKTPGRRGFWTWLLGGGWSATGSGG